MQSRTTRRFWRLFSELSLGVQRDAKRAYGDRTVTISLPLQPQEEARLAAVARAKGLSTDALVREALDRILAEASAIPASVGPVSGAVLVAAMQASPCREIGLEVPSHRLPVRDVRF